VGVVTATPGYSLELKDRSVDLSGYSIYARDFPDVKDYLAAIIQFLKDET
jgi:hypothetical protein